jgi:hypothetical protein
MARVQVQQRNARVAVPVQCEFIETAHGQVLAKTTPPDGRPGLFRPDDKLLAFLKSL